MAISLNKNDYGQLVDPFNGIADLEAKNIQTPLAPGITFSDDPLRMMRAIRFATQLNFSIEEKTFAAIGENAERIKIVSGERIADELNKIVLSLKPSIGFDLLYKSGLLKIIFPQMVALAGAEYVDGMGIRIIFITLYKYWIILLKTRMTFGCVGQPYYMILPSLPLKSLKKATAGLFMAMKPWVEDGYLKFLHN